MLRLIPVSEKDVEKIQNLASGIWWKYYPPIIGFKQVQYMLDKFYSTESIEKQLNELNHQFYLINLNNKEVGFISIEHKGRKKYFIHKFYIQQKFSNKGIGTKVFKLILKRFNPSEIKLTVNRQNIKAINFYFKNGFVIEKVADFDIGQGFYMNDFIMVWKK